jgi:hypothetical protein
MFTVFNVFFKTSLENEETESSTSAVPTLVQFVINWISRNTQRSMFYSQV